MKEEDRKYCEYALNSMISAENEKRKYNGYKNKKERVCFYCGKPYAERHEVFHGTANRNVSLKMGFQVDLCAEHHEKFHKGTTAQVKAEKNKWKRIYQRVYMARLVKKGYKQEVALKEWMHLIGENCIKELSPK